MQSTDKLLGMSNSSKSSSVIWNVVISGASKGIGREMAATFAKAGHQLFLTARNEAKLKETADALISQFPPVKSTIRLPIFRSRKKRLLLDVGVFPLGSRTY